MFKQRLITALILIPLVIIILLYMPPVYFFLFTTIVVLAGTWEWTCLMSITKLWQRCLYLVVMILAMLVFALFIPIFILLCVTFIWWLIAATLIFIYPRGSHWWGRPILCGLIGVISLVPCWVALNYIRNENPNDGIYAILFLFILIWGADSAAYFCGKKWGTNKLVPQISPGKTKQGVYGALIYTVFIALLTLSICHTPFAIWPWGVALSLITVVFSIVGDLLESMLKRQVGLKDSSQVLPGHGGILDRIDSLTAAAPIFAFGAMLLGMYLPQVS